MEVGPATLEHVVADAQAAWPGVMLDAAAFERYLVERGWAPADGPAPTSPLHTSDLYLACACVQGVAGALEVFDRQLLRDIGPAVRSIDASPTFADEIRQRLRERLFIEGKLATYTGRGPLAAWLMIVAQRVALTIKRREQPQRAFFESLEGAIVRSERDPELAYMKERYRPELERVVRQAIATLPDRDRLLLRLTLLTGITHERIAGMYQVSQSTVTRWVQQAHERLRGEVEKALGDALGAAIEDVESLMRLFRSDVNVSVTRALASSTSP